MINKITFLGFFFLIFINQIFGQTVQESIQNGELVTSSCQYNKILIGTTWHQGVGYKVYLDMDGDGLGTGPHLTVNWPPPFTLPKCIAPENVNSLPSNISIYRGDCDDNVFNEHQILYEDKDGDGFGNHLSNAFHYWEGCNSIPTDYPYVANKLDCNDNEPTITTGSVTWYVDNDGDGYGNNIDPTIQVCFAGPGYSLNNLDCNDSDFFVTTDPVFWFADLDGDGYGDPDNTIESCFKPNNYVKNSSDKWCPNDFGLIDGCPEVEYNFGNYNYNYSRQYIQGFKQLELDNSINEDVLKEVIYFDGHGKSKLSIAINAGGNKEDLIIPITYDSFGRQTKEYLATPKLNNNGSYIDVSTAVNDVYQYYQTNYSDDLPQDFGIINSNPYNEKRYENSPLNRVLEQGAPGTDWLINTNLNTGHTIKFDYQTNKSDEVKFFEVDFLNGNTKTPELKSICNKYYEAGQLYKTVTKDENWQLNQTNPKDHTTEEFTDKFGRIVLKRAYNEGEKYDTYYVHDDYGNLTYVLSPRASDALVSQSKSQVANITESTYIPWTSIVSIDKSLAEEYEKLIQELDENDPETQQKLIEKYGGYGGISITLDSSNNITVNIDITLANPITQASKILYTFTQINNTLSDAKLGTITGTDYSYTIGVSNNSIVIDGRGTISQLQQTFTTSVPEECILDQEIIDRLAYQYVYDYKNRRIRKKIPEKGWEDIIYDELDRPVLTSDAILKAQGKWLFTKYDSFGRIAYTGLFNPITVLSAEEIRNIIANGNTNIIMLFETRLSTPTTIGGTEIYYSNNTYPSESLDILTINYYDDYGINENILNGLPTSISTLPTEIYGANLNRKNTKNLATINKVRILETDNWITYVKGYDDKRRVIYTSDYNEFLNTNNNVKNKLDFTGKVIESELNHTKDINDPVIIKDYFTYDHMGRLKSQNQEINNQNREQIATNIYDAIGRLTSKNVGGFYDPNNSNQVSNSLQYINYKYNIRGWLTGINDDNIGAIPANYTNLFTFKIRYNQPEKGNSTPLYNGNISETYWRTSNDSGLSQNKTRGYRYNYDALNRITSANSFGGLTSNSKAHSENFSIRNIVYDKNGNLLTLKRLGLIETTNQYDVIDNLSYIYRENSNQLLAVSDRSEVIDGFRDGINRSDDFAYDKNGNLIIDKNKTVTSIDYNHLNLPNRVSKNFDNDGYIEYIYDATGGKLAKTLYLADNNFQPIRTLYDKNFIYRENGVTSEMNLEFINFSGGYIYKKENENFDYVYQYVDHLGNTRLSYSDSDGDGVIDPDNEIIKESNYYPFGLKQKGYNFIVDGIENNFKTYQGQEFTQDLNLNIHEWNYRTTDPSIGRFWQLDPLAEDYPYNSTYSFQENKLGMGGELEGLEVIGNDYLQYLNILYHSYMSNTSSARDLFSEVANDRVEEFRTGQDRNNNAEIRVGSNKVRVSDLQDTFKVSEGLSIYTQETARTSIIIGRDLASSLEVAGDGITYFGIATGQPEIVAVGEAISKTGSAINISIDLIEGKDFGTIVIDNGPELVFGKLGKETLDALKANGTDNIVVDIIIEAHVITYTEITEIIINKLSSEENDSEDSDPSNQEQQN